MISFNKILSIAIFLIILIFLMIVLPLQVLHDARNEKSEENERRYESHIVEVVNTTNSTTVNLTIYYESECPFSTEFFRDQLLPNYKNFSGYMKLDFVPSGSAKYKKMDNGTYEFKCQHGPLECEENKLQACAIDKLSKLSPSPVNEFIICYQSMDEKNPKDCAEKYDIDLRSIQSCADSIEGDELRVKFTNRTRNFQPKIPSVPFLMVNDVFDSSVNEDFRDDFVEAVCNKLNYMPEICSSIS